MNSTEKNIEYSIAGHGSIKIDISGTKRNYYPAEINSTEHFYLKINGTAQTEVEEIKKFILFEWQPLSFIAVFDKSDSLGKYTLFVNGKEVKKSNDVNNIKLLNAGFTFKNQVGLTELKIIDPSGKEIFCLQTEVFPQKMDYKSDYKAIMQDISKIIHNLTYSILKDTYQKAKPKVAGHTTEVEWWNILDTLYQALMKSFDIIRRNPKHEIVAEQKVTSVDRIKKPSNKNRVWLQKNTKYISKSSKNGVELIKDNYFTHALSLKKRITYDNYENRFIKFAAKQTVFRLIAFKRDIENNNLHKAEFLLDKINGYVGRLNGLLLQSPFNEVGEFEKQNHFSTTLTKASGYKDFLQIHLLLQKGLDILNDDIFKIESKNISQLYEYWCFLKLTEIVMNLSNFEIKYQDLIKVQTGKFKVDLKEGKQSKIQFKNLAEEEITIYFNKEFDTRNRKTFTYNQKPDHSIKFTKEGYAKPFWFIFDAKYRFSENESNYDVPDDAIGQLHRYRDAILHAEYNTDDTSYKATIKNLGGIILYPYPETEDSYVPSKYFKSIDEVNIGALPLLPSKTSLVENYLRKIFIERTPEDHFREFVGMDYSEYNTKRQEFNKTVTIGLIKSADQKARLTFLKNSNLHYFPSVDDQSSRIYNSDYLLITRSKQINAELRRVKKWEKISRDDLKNKGITWRLNHTNYILFHLESEEEILQITPDIIPTNFRYTTLRALSVYRKEKESQALYITNESAYKLFALLKRKNLEFSLSWPRNSTDKTAVIFTLHNGIVIESSDSFPYLSFMEKEKRLSWAEVLKRIN